MLAYWTREFPQDGWTVTSPSHDGAPVTAAKRLVGQPEHSYLSAPESEVIVYPGGRGTKSQSCVPNGQELREVVVTLGADGMPAVAWSAAVVPMPYTGVIDGATAERIRTAVAVTRLGVDDLKERT